MFKQPGSRLMLAALLLGVPCGSPASETPAPASGVTLTQCYQKAHEITEAVGISAENTKALQAQYRSTIGSVLPHIDWIASRFFQEKVSSSATGIGGSALRSSQPESYFQLQQPIFAGLRDFAVASIAKSQAQQARYAQTETDLLLLSDVAVAFYTAYTLQDQLTVYQEVRKLNLDQVNQLSHWVEIGRSRPSELLSAQTQTANLDAQIQDTRRNLTQARHVLFYLTGVPAEVPLIDGETTPGPLTLEEALRKADNRPEVMSAEEGLRQGELGVRYARGAYFPIVGFLGRYYTERVGFLEDIKWDATVNLDVPIYEGGTTQSNVRVARSQEIIARLDLSRVKRSVNRDVRTAFDDLQDSLAEAQAYDKAVQLAQQNYAAQQKEYRLGVISNLDLLALLSSTQEIRRQTLIARANAKLSGVRLRIAMGEGL